MTVRQIARATQRFTAQATGQPGSRSCWLLCRTSPARTSAACARDRRKSLPVSHGGYNSRRARPIRRAGRPHSCRESNLGPTPRRCRTCRRAQRRWAFSFRFMRLAVRILIVPSILRKVRLVAAEGIVRFARRGLRARQVFPLRLGQEMIVLPGHSLEPRHCASCQLTLMTGWAPRPQLSGMPDVQSPCVTHASHWAKVSSNSETAKGFSIVTGWGAAPS